MAAQLRIRLVGDHSHEHCGCAAVTETLGRQIAAIGRRVGEKELFDVLVVNGEGSMHHGRRAFLLKMHQIRAAQDRGARTFLVNSVWQSNPGAFDDCLRRLDGLIVRGPASARDLLARHAVEAPHALDLSYFARVDENAPFTDLGGAVAATDFPHPGFGFAWPSGAYAGAWPRVDLTAMGWSSLVRTLRTASVLVAGRHHAVYAACKARTPFVPVRGNSHKLDDLFESAGVEIPIVEDFSELAPMLKWVSVNRKIYDLLFDWMAAQHEPHFTKARELVVQSPKPAPGARALAVAASHRRAHGEAAARWREVAAQEERVPFARLACMSLFAAGDVETAVDLLAREREAKPHSIVLPRLAVDFARETRCWIARDGADGWWPKLREAAYRAEIGDDAGLETRALEAFDDVGRKLGPVASSTASLLLAAKLIQLNKHRQAFALRRISEKAAQAPDWAADQERLLLNSTTRRFDVDALELLARIRTQPCWADPACRVMALKHRAMFEGVGPAIAEEARDHLAAFPTHPGLLDLAISFGGEAGRLDFAEDLFGAERKRVLDAALRHLPLARFLKERSLASSPALERRAALIEHLEAGRAALEAVLSDRSTSIAVVGNSPVGRGRGAGERIDAHDVVIRFNDFETAGFEADYGAKTDIAFQTYPLSRATKLKATPPGALIVQRHAFNIFDPRDWEPVLSIREAGRRLGYLSRGAYISAARLVEATPSAGLAVARFMQERRGALSREDFFGFSFVDQLSGDCGAHYFSNESPSFIHDWEREAVEFEKLFAADDGDASRGPAGAT